MSNVTIQEDFTLPSLGKVYKKQFNPDIRLRSMTVAEEMKRLTATDMPYKNMAEILEACLQDKLPISVYDLCLGDYQFLLHKSRVVTYGPEYNVQIRCPHCGEVFDHIIDLDSVEVHEYDESFEKLKVLILPASGETVELRFQTPRDLDNIEKKKKALKKQFPDMKEDPTLMLNLETLIESVDGQTLDQISLREYVKNMPLRDSTAILKAATKLNTKVGLDTAVTAICENCGGDVNTSFRYTSEFFRPEA